MRLLRDPDKGTTGVDGIAVWVLAGITASLSALDADSFREVCLRLVAPMVAAWMWERALAAERSARLGRTVQRVHWTITVERIFVWLRLAEAHDRDVTQVDRARRRARLARARLHLHLLQTREAPPARRVRRAHNRVIRLAMQSAEHTGLADFPNAHDERQAMQMYMATLYGLVEATSPESVLALNAWRATSDASDPPTVGRTASPIEPPLREPDARGETPPSDDQQTDSDRRGTHRLAIGTAESPSDATVVEIHSRTSQRERDHVRPPGPDEEPADDLDQPDTDEGCDSSSVAAMRRFWDNSVKRGHIPSGAELSRAAGVPPTTGLGRRKRREWEAEVGTLLHAAPAKATPYQAEELVTGVHSTIFRRNHR